MALLARLHPAGVVVAAFLFGMLEAGSNAMQRSAGVSSVLASVVQAAVVFSLLAVESVRFVREREAEESGGGPERLPTTIWWESGSWGHPRRRCARGFRSATSIPGRCRPLRLTGRGPARGMT